MGGPFSLRCLSPLCSPAGGTGQTQSMRVELLQCSLAGFAAQKNRLVFSLRLMLCLLNQRVAWDASSRLGYSCNTKDQRVFFHTLAFIASHEARRRMAVFAIQLAWSHIRPSSREACCRAAVSPQPSRISLECPAPYGRGVGCRGSPPAARPVAERRSWGRKRRKHEAFRRVFPERHAYLYIPARP